MDFRTWQAKLKEENAERPDVRNVQARKLWDLGLGKELGFGSFEEYLATIPIIKPSMGDPEKLMLVDRRVSLERVCEILGVAIKETLRQSITATEVSSRRKMYWLSVQQEKSCVTRPEKHTFLEVLYIEHASELLAFFAQHSMDGDLETIYGIPANGRRVKDHFFYHQKTFTLTRGAITCVEVRENKKGKLVDDEKKRLQVTLGLYKW